MVKISTRYSIVDKELVVGISKDNLLQTITSLALLKEEVIKKILLINNKHTFLLSVDNNISETCLYDDSLKKKSLILSSNSLEYVYFYLLELLAKGFTNVNHVHLEFYKQQESEISLVFLIEDTTMVHWQDEILE